MLRLLPIIVSLLTLVACENGKFVDGKAFRLGEGKKHKFPPPATYQCEYTEEQWNQMVSIHPKGLKIATESSLYEDGEPSSTEIDIREVIESNDDVIHIVGTYERGEVDEIDKVETRIYTSPVPCEKHLSYFGIYLFDEGHSSILSFNFLHLLLGKKDESVESKVTTVEETLTLMDSEIETTKETTLLNLINSDGESKPVKFEVWSTEYEGLKFSEFKIVITNIETGKLVFTKDTKEIVLN